MGKGRELISIYFFFFFINKYLLWIRNKMFCLTLRGKICPFINFKFLVDKSNKFEEVPYNYILF